MDPTDSVAGLGAQDNVLAANERSLDVVNPDEIGVVDGDGVATPNVFRVKIGDVDVLDDNVGCTADDTETLSLDDTGTALADDGLVGSNDYAERGSVVVRDTDRLGVRLVVSTPVVLVDGVLTSRSASVGVGAASSCRSGTLGVEEVKRLGKDNDSGLRVTKVGDQLSVRGRVDWRGRTTSSNALCEALSSAVNSDGCGGLDHCRQGNGKERSILHTEKKKKKKKSKE